MHMNLSCFDIPLKKKQKALKNKLTNKYSTNNDEIQYSMNRKMKLKNSSNPQLTTLR